MDNIRGKTVVITGGARGIGQATAKALLARGARVVIGDRDFDVLEKAVTGSHLGSVSGHPLDVTDRESFTAFLDKARADGGGHIDVLINNAGVMPVGKVPRAVATGDLLGDRGQLLRCAQRLPAGAAGDGQAPQRTHRQHRFAGRHGRGARAGRLRRYQIRRGRALHRAGRRIRPQGVIVTAVLPTFTNTELISGTTLSAAQKPVQPEDVAAAVVKVLDKPKTQVAVPRWGRHFSIMAMLLPARGRRWLNKKMGNDTVFLNLDTKSRQAYEDRAHHATGVIEHKA